MAYDEYLADRLRQVMDSKKISYQEKKMFGGIAFMVDGKMCFGINDEKLMARVGADFHQEALQLKGCIPMNFTGRPMKGYVYVHGEGIEYDKDLEFWVEKCLEFNPKAKSSRKK